MTRPLALLIVSLIVAPIAALVPAEVRAQRGVEPLPDPGPPPEAPAEGEAPLPPKVLDSRAQSEPTVTITQGEDGEVVEEYRQNGSVYMVKVTPKNGVVYYLYDEDGDGTLESRWTEVQGVVEPVRYKIKEWK